MKTVKFFPILLLFALLCSCSLTDKVKVDSFDGIDMDRLSSLTLNLKATNNSCHSLRLNDAAIAVSSGSTRVGTLTLRAPVGLASHSSSRLSIPLDARFENPLSALSLVRNLQRNPDRITLTGTATVKFGLFKRRFTFNELPLSKFLSTFNDSDTKSTDTEQIKTYKL